MDNTAHALFSRFSAGLVATALKDTPVVMVTGPRQCGKTTLVRDLIAGKREFITMDDDTVLAAARSDPTGLGIKLVPGGGVEPPRYQVPADFESAASASSAIPALRGSE
jgi:hypothetical protein